MFKLLYVAQAGQPHRVSDFLFVPPSLRPSLESPEIEKVSFDEMSNMTWAIEQLYEGELGDPVPGYESDIIAAAARNSENKGEAEEKQESNKNPSKVHYANPCSYKLDTIFASTCSRKQSCC